MKRRRFFQYAGLGSIGFCLVARDLAVASVPIQENRSLPLGLSPFEFDVTTVNRAGQLKQVRRHQARFFPEFLNRSERLEMVAISSGEFRMGASRAETQAKGHEFPQHRVKVSPFFISKYPVTQAQWAAVAALPKVHRDLNPDPSHFQGKTLPVESVSWLEAMEFCDRISQHTGRRYQLPSEAQWEYACRAGTQTPFHAGETITHQLANYVSSYTYKAEEASPYPQATLPVDRVAPNAFGLYGMHGNVWEWCADSWHASYRGAPTNGQAWIANRSAQMRAIRGGGWLDTPDRVRSASRSGYLETALNRTIGFRVVTV